MLAKRPVRGSAEAWPASLSRLNVAFASDDVTSVRTLARTLASLLAVPMLVGGLGGAFLSAAPEKSVEKLPIIASKINASNKFVIRHKERRNISPLFRFISV